MIDHALESLFPQMRYTNGRHFVKTRPYPLNVNTLMIYYQFPPTQERFGIVETEEFCDAWVMDGEDKLLWVLKFGKYLPNFYVDGELK